MYPWRLDPLVLELQVVVSCLVLVLGENTKLGSSTRARSSLDCWIISATHWLLFYFLLADHSKIFLILFLFFYNLKFSFVFKSIISHSQLRCFPLHIEIVAEWFKSFACLLPYLNTWTCPLLCEAMRNTSQSFYTENIWTTS